MTQALYDQPRIPHGSDEVEVTVRRSVTDGKHIRFLRNTRQNKGGSCSASHCFKLHRSVNCCIQGRDTASTNGSRASSIRTSCGAFRTARTTRPRRSSARIAKDSSGSWRRALNVALWSHSRSAGAKRSPIALVNSVKS